jgi:uncharacterized membrane protein YphA (DoxX/SURF4 family)
MNAEAWSFPRRAAFRFFFCYFVLFFLTDRLVDLIPFSGVFLRSYAALTYRLVVWVDGHILHTGFRIDPPFEGGGINNTAHGTLLCLCYVALAAMAAVLWPVLDRRRAGYGRLHEWFRLLLRFSLALAMIQYGILKLIPTQMIAPPPLGFHLRRAGDFTHMQLLWFFMGASPVYESLTGAAELLGGVLLLFPRTTLLGALICAADMGMVFTLNMCYDVHVKLYSFHLLLMAVLLLAPDLPRLANLFLFNRTVEPAVTPPLSERKWVNRLPQILLLVVGLSMIGVNTADALKRYQKFHPPKPPLYGLWSVDRFVIDGAEVPLFTDAKRWRYVVFQRPGSVSVEQMIGSRQGYALDLDMDAKTLRLSEGAAVRAAFAFAEPQPDAMVLEGQLDGHRAHLELSKAALSARSFHWLFEPKEE